MRIATVITLGLLSSSLQAAEAAKGGDKTANTAAFWHACRSVRP